MKISRSKLTSIIQESIRKHMLNESRAYAHKKYSPWKEEFISDEEYENLPQELQDVYYNDYQISFVGDSWYSSGRDEPSEWGVDNIELNDDDGLSEDIKMAATISPEFAQKLKDNFEDWYMKLDYNWLEFEEDEQDPPEYDPIDFE